MEKRQKSGEARVQHSEEENGNLTKDTTGGVSNQANNGSEKPYIGMEFESEEAAKNMYDAYAGRVGFSTHVGRYKRPNPDGPVVSWEFTCPREVSKRKTVESCGALLRIDRKDAKNWVVTKFVEDHNHSVSSSSNVQYPRPRRHFAGSTKGVAETDDNQNEVMVSFSGDHVTYDPNGSHVDKIPIVRKNSYFIQPSSRKRILGRDGHNLLAYFGRMQAENPGFYYSISLDDDDRVSNVFWADARSRTAYRHFGDTVTFDTMYRPNQFQVPFAPFTGINNHGQTVLFGCALILDESEASFTWVFNTWLSAMNNRPPISITTDQDRAIKAAVHRVFPQTRHCICKWHILREGQERLSHVYLAHPSFYGEIYGCINFSETIEDFESSWSLILDKYDLQKHEWLQAVYNARKQWVPVYFRDTFFAAISSNHGVSSFFDGYVNQQMTVPMFFMQYERALENALEREVEADYDTICTTPVLKTPSPMEQQAANLYTKKVFAKFQEELVETFVYTANKIEGDGTVSKFRVAKYEHDHKAYIVTLDVSEMNASCSCQMFEYSGVLCRHILTVFTVTNVLTVPSRYIIKRWTRNARDDLSDEQETDKQRVESLSMRFKYLCSEALRFAEEGSIATETYNASMDVLREGAKKISMLKKNVAKIGSFLDNSSKKASMSTPDAIPSSWPWKGTTSNRLNLNDTGVLVPDSNHPTMAPIAINRDGSLADNTVVLTCFKSMAWVIENKNMASKVAVISLKLDDYGKAPLGETDVQFRLTRVTLEPMIKSMVYISQQLSLPANRVAVINLKDSKTSSGEADVKFQVTRDTLDSMLRSMACIQEHL